MLESNNIVINNTQQIQIMNHKLSLDVKKLELPLPTVHEGKQPGEEEMGDRANNLKQLI